MLQPPHLVNCFLSLWLPGTCSISSMAVLLNGREIRWRWTRSWKMVGRRRVYMLQLCWDLYTSESYAWGWPLLKRPLRHLIPCLDSQPTYIYINYKIRTDKNGVYLYTDLGLRAANFVHDVSRIRQCSALCRWLSNLLPAHFLFFLSFSSAAMASVKKQMTKCSNPSCYVSGSDTKLQ